MKGQASLIRAMGIVADDYFSHNMEIVETIDEINMEAERSEHCLKKIKNTIHVLVIGIQKTTDCRYWCFFKFAVIETGHHTKICYLCL